MDRDGIARVLAEWQAMRNTDTDADPGLEAVRLAVVLEDLLGITLTDADIDLAVLTDAAAVAHRLAR